MSVISDTSYTSYTSYISDADDKSDLLKKYINNIKENNEKISDLIRDKDIFSQDDWDEVTENYENMPEIVANEFIVRKKDLGNKIGINFLIVLYNQNYPEDFYDQDFIKELLDMSETEYHKIMGQYNSLCSYNTLWENFFYANQWFISEKYILKNAEHFINMHGLQRYQEVPVSFYEKYIHDDRLEHINFYDQTIPIVFVLKHIKNYPDKMCLTNIWNISELTENIFKELLSYKVFSDEKSQNTLWLTVGAYNISEEFIRNNILKINLVYRDIVITNMYKSPWHLIFENKIKYSEQLFEENIKYIRAHTQQGSLFDENTSQNFSKQFIRKYYNYDNCFNNTSYIETILNYPSINSMDIFVERRLKENKINFKNMSKSHYLSLNLVEKYKDDLYFEYVCRYNKNITIDYFITKIMVWFPDLKLDVETYLYIDKLSEKNILFFIETYSKKYSENDIKHYLDYAKEIIITNKNNYSNKVKNAMKDYQPHINKQDMAKIAPLNSLLHNFTMDRLLNH